MLGKFVNKKTGKKPLTYWEKQALEKAAEKKKRVNVFLTRSAGEGSGTTYEESKTAFAGGEVKSRSRVSLVGSDRNEPEKNKFGGIGNRSNSVGMSARQNKVKTGFAKSSTKTTSFGKGSSPLPPKRPIGF